MKNYDMFRGSVQAYEDNAGFIHLVGEDDNGDLQVAVSVNYKYSGEGLNDLTHFEVLDKFEDPEKLLDEFSENLESPMNLLWQIAQFKDGKAELFVDQMDSCSFAYFGIAETV